MKLKSLENMLAAALTDANEIQKENRTKEMAMTITYIENAQDKVWRLKNNVSDEK